MSFRSRWLTIVFSLVTLDAYGADNNTFYIHDSGALACGAVLRRSGPVDGVRYASAFYFSDPLGPNPKRAFLATAAHNLQGNISKILVGNAAGQFSLLDNRHFKPLFLIDLAQDLAVFECSDALQEELMTRKEGKRLVGQLLGHEIAPRGGAAAAVGTIEIKQGPLPWVNLAYGCTLSRYDFGDRLVDAFNAPYRESRPEGTDKVLAAHREGVRRRLMTTHYLFVETMSITFGFSGSPIMISNDHYLTDGRIVGLVLGGAPKDVAGRSAWAIPASQLSEASARVASANKSPRQLEEKGWRKLIDTRGSDENALVYESTNDIAKWIATSRSWLALNSGLGDRLTPAFASGYNAENYVEFSAMRDDDRDETESSAIQFVSDGGDNNGIRKPSRLNSFCGPQVTLAMSEYPGYSFKFKGFQFNQTCLDGAVLLNPVFEDCFFSGTQFDGAIITGALFRRCRYQLGDGRVVPVNEDVLHPCKRVPCRPAIVVGSQFLEVERPFSGSRAPGFFDRNNDY